MKILHCSDLHLGKKPFGMEKFVDMRYNDYFKAFDFIVDFAIDNNIDIVLISGDIFDKREILPDTLQKTEAILAKLKDKNIKVFFTEGNHDNIIYGKEINSWLIYLEKQGYLKRLSYTFNIDSNGIRSYCFEKITVDDVNFYGIGYPGFKVDDILLELEKELKPDEKNIVLVHTAISNNDLFPGTVDKKTIDKLKDKVIYIAGGHLHFVNIYPFKRPYFFVPGSPEYWNITNEVGQKKGFIVFDTDTLKYKFYESKKREVIEKVLNLEVLNIDEFDREFRYILDNINITKESILVLEIYLLNSSFFINVKKYQDLFKDRGVLECYIKIHYKNQISSNINYNSFISVEDIEKDIISKWPNLGVYSDFIVDNLKLLKEYQKLELKQNFIEQFDKMINYILDNYENK